ncbi:hypothetical protein B0A55_02939 [Friedmanniomyces simplex]|uniref:Zn(2)-C6 fungal-type domain-containing protein n=1 Tax=Friedmanniomyces simplex TaxID=329884 RepID=A0A4U0XUJ7_9PEZI|nr:hypothetical protein B0A55_02939 [Friedmanniomyces simplex]
MMENSRDESPGEDYFNDMSQQVPADEERRGSQDDNGQVPKPKRIACVLCRKRKLKCDGNRPSCSTCTRLQHECSYDEVRRKSGPKRGYVKALEARLAQVETLLKTQDEPGPTARKESGPPRDMVPDFENIAIGRDNSNILPHTERAINRHDGPAQTQYPHSMLGASASGNTTAPAEESFPWEMIGLGLDEPLPKQDVVNELNQIYFDKIHPSVPMIHRPRYYAAMNLAPHMRPPVCLRYAMWCNAAAVTDKYEALQEHFYYRARKYLQQDEMKGHGESMITTAHCQAWILVATYEFKSMYFPRAWMSSGRGSRMVQMMGLHRLDGVGLDVKQCLPPPKDWTEREERRRTFWMSFCTDRYSSIGTGWPMSIEERDVLTCLPSEEADFELSRPGKTMSLEEALLPDGAVKLSSFAGVVLMACLFGRNLTHLHRPGPDDRDDDLNGEFWKRHRNMDNILLNTALALPDALRLPSGLNDANIIWMNMNIHTSTICLHQAAIFKADRNRMPSRISAESKVRCITAASEIASTMRQISHLDLSAMNPFISFCLYVAARVFVQYLKSRPKDTQVRASLQFLLSAMHAIKRKNPLTESFLVQLDVDLESAGLEDARQLRAAAPKLAPEPARYEGCPFTIGMQQADSAGCRPTYGDQGLSLYNDPNSASNIVPPASVNVNSLDYTSAEMSDYISGTAAFELPNRQRTPGSVHTSSNYRSPPQGNLADMDISPDGSNDLPTPNSSTNSQPNASSGTSNTDYSPQNHQQQPYQQYQQQYDPSANPALPHNDPDHTQLPNAFMFDVNNFGTEQQQPQQSGFVLPENWSAAGPTGFTPGAAAATSTGMTPGAMNDMMGMSDADWTQMLDGFEGNGWDAGLQQEAGAQVYAPPPSSTTTRRL